MDNWLKRHSSKTFKLNKDEENVRYTLKESRRIEELLKEWYGQDLAAKEIAAHRDNTEKMSDLIPALMKDLNLEQQSAFATIDSHWEILIGPGIATRIKPAFIKRKCLFLEANDSTSLYALSSSKMIMDKLLEKVKELTDNYVVQIKVIQKGRG